MKGWTNSFLIPMTRKLKAGLFKEFETRTGFDRFEQFFVRFGWCTAMWESVHTKTVEHSPAAVENRLLPCPAYNRQFVSRPRSGLEEPSDGTEQQPELPQGLVPRTKRAGTRNCKAEDVRREGRGDDRSPVLRGAERSEAGWAGNYAAAPNTGMAGPPKSESAAQGSRQSPAKRGDEGAS